MKLAEVLKNTETTLKAAGINTARIDAVVLLAFCLKLSKEELLANLDQNIKPAELRHCQKLLQQRLQRTPVAYLTGNKEFFGLEFKVNPQVLIPRPASEALVEMALEGAPPHSSLLDIGTGSGALAIAIGKHRPDIVITATDISLEALAIAKINAKKHQVQIEFIPGSLFSNITKKYDVIIANLPYVSTTQTVSPETAQEPSQALYAGIDGLNYYRDFFNQANNYLRPDGTIIIEAEPAQHSDLRKLARNLTPLEVSGYALRFTKVEVPLQG